jgi:uncharacterized protein YqkB
MRIEWTPAARDWYATHNTDPRPLKLVYDIEGCGCAVDGVVRLWRVAETEPEDGTACEFPAVILYNGRQAVFFEDRLILDVQERAGTFILKSDNQIYATGLFIEDKTGEAQTR